ncbi:universal stress protein [Octadecabacter sp. G9-8]|uniref:Universal stress protein n=1 Tax=Octadecabacter dasysiphoniae TaxID=2909341 RepID=A0ABS9CZS1_9RHOB|nr:universal stress protein [Octadecabacter dasysiphoniae]MCF2872753.1 universal stress protein [Octadecabacter dasysiphoniae]
MFSKIVVGFDGSQMSDRALRLACDLAQKYESELHLVHTPQPRTVAFAMGAVAGYHTVTTMPSAAEIKEGNAKMLAAGKAIATEHGQTIAQTHVKSGEPGDVIVQYADKVGADLIVSGRHGHGVFSAMVQGSTSLRINHIAKCATLSVI